MSIISSSALPRALGRNEKPRRQGGECLVVVVRSTSRSRSFERMLHQQHGGHEKHASDRSSTDHDISIYLSTVDHLDREIPHLPLLL